MCHRASHAAWRCVCGDEQHQRVERVRALLQAQHGDAWITLLLLLTLDAAAVGGAVYAAVHGFIVFSAIGFSALILMTARAMRRVLVARANLRRLADRYPPLPTAVVRKH